MTNEALIERIKVNLVFIGLTQSGKTSIVRSLIGQEFKEESAPTVGVDFVDIRAAIENQTILMHCFDTSGKEAYLQITKNYLVHANIVLLVVDVSKEDIAPDLEYFRQILQSIPINSKVLLCLNKADKWTELEEPDKSKFATKFEEVAGQELAGVILTSPKNGVGFKTEQNFQASVLTLISDLMNQNKITSASSDSDLQGRTNLCALDCCVQKRGSKFVRPIFTILYFLGAASSFVLYILLKVWNLQSLTSYLMHHTILSKLIALNNTPILTIIFLVLFFNVFISLFLRKNVNLIQDVAISVIPILAPVVIKITEKMQENQHHALPALFKNNLL
jgi:small GTP-binding protein